MRHYESVIVFDAKLTDEAVGAEADKVEALIKQLGAEQVEKELWGRREIAWEARRKKTNKGVYVCFYYGADNSELVDSMNSSLRINDNVLLFQTHRLDVKTRKFKGRIKSANSEEAQLA